MTGDVRVSNKQKRHCNVQSKGKASSFRICQGTGSDGIAYLVVRARRVVGWMQWVDQDVLPNSLQIEMEKRP